VKRRRNTPEQIVRKLREADRLLAEVPGAGGREGAGGLGGDVSPLAGAVGRDEGRRRQSPEGAGGGERAAEADRRAAAGGRRPHARARPPARRLRDRRGRRGAVVRVLRERGFGPSRLVVLERLGAPDERIVASSADDWHGTADPLHAVAIECRAAAGAPLLGRIPGLPDDAYEHDRQSGTALIGPDPARRHGWPPARIRQRPHHLKLDVAPALARRQRGLT
jgi:hypothetical protein